MFPDENITSNVNFTMDWKVDECGGVFESTTGMITSPNYPQKYSPSLDCAWQIIVPEGSTIQVYLHFYI
jgi:cubilin